MPLHQPRDLSRNQWVATGADCALGTMRAVAELMPAVELTRQQGCRRRVSGDRVMEGLKMDCVALTAMATAVAGMRNRALGAY